MNIVREHSAKRHPSLHGPRVVAAFALGGAVFGGLLFGWIPALAAIDVHAVGAAVGGFVGAIASARHII